MPSRENISYLVPRDPSIKCWSDRVKLPAPCTRNLVQLGSEEFEDTMGDHIKVYLRLKPSTSPENPYTVLTPTMLQTEAPKESVSYKNVKNGVGKLIHKFTFTTILDQDVTQAELFKISAVKNLKSFLSGKNYLLMAYGTTSAGKTYTMQGNVGNPGVIPRALDFVFTALKGSVIPVCRYIPYQYKELLELSEDQVKKNLVQKNFILSLDLSKCQRYPGGSQSSILTGSGSDFSGSYENSTFKEMQSNLMETECFEIDFESCKYSVWISMIEIYNEQVYDLLEVPNSRGERSKLIFRDDEDGHTFVKNLNYVNVSTGHEAFQILQFGRSNLHFAPTALNNRSSRSHCIFIITVARFLDYDMSSQAIISRFSFCDLAGMERTKKALNVKDRLLESKAINTSLSILAKCLTTIKENQNSNDKKMIPYRESKLTKLFRDAIMGKEQLSIIVNVTTEPNLFDETLNVLKFSAIAQEIVTQNVFAKPVVCRSRFSRIVINSSCNTRRIDWEASVINAKLKDETSDSGVEDCKGSIEFLKDALEREKKRNEQIEIQIREELTSKFSEMLKKQDENNELRLENESERLKQMYEKKEKRIIHYYETLRQKKRQRLEEDLSDFEDQRESLRELEEESKKLRSENSTLKQNLQDLMMENNKLQSECSELKFKLVDKDRSLEAMRRANEANDAGADELLKELRKQLDFANETITYFKTLLNEAASDYMELEGINKNLRNEKEILEQDLTKHRETVADLKNENAELQKILSQRRILIEKLEDANEEFRKKFTAKVEAEEKHVEETVRHEQLNNPGEFSAEENENLNENCREPDTQVKTLKKEVHDPVGSSAVESLKLEKQETEKNIKVEEEKKEDAKGCQEKEIQECSVKLEESSSKENSPFVNVKIKGEPEPATETMAQQSQNILVQQTELKSTRKKVDLLGTAIHPSSLKNTNRGRKKKEEKEKKAEKLMENEKENFPASSKKKNKCYRKLFIENGFDDYVDLNVSPLEEMPRLRPRIAIVYNENKN